MKKYRLTKDNPQELSEEQILKHKDFKRLMYRYEEVTTPLYQRPLYKNPRVFLGLVLVVIIVWLIFSAQDEKPAETPASEPIESVD